MEWTGTFEVPGSGVRVGGRLTIDAGHSTLTTFGALSVDSTDASPSDRPLEPKAKSIPMVWGVAEDGSRLTLIDLTSLGGDLTGPGAWTTRQQWICACAVGGHIEPEDRLTFSSISFGLTDLSAWLDTPHPEEEEVTRDHPRLELSVGNHEIAEVFHGGITFHFDATWGTRRALDEVTLEYPAKATGTSSVELSWEQLVNSVVTPIEVLLWVATGRFSLMDDLRVRLDGPRPVYEPLWVSLLRPRSFEPPRRRLNPSEMLFAATDMPGGLESGISNWLAVWQDIEPAFGPVIARYRAPFTYANDRFHAAVAALESYSSYKHGERAISRDARNQRITKVKQALQNGAPELTDWVVEALAGAHRHTLRTRLNLLLDEAGDIGEALVGSGRDRFVDVVVKSRDSYAHSALILGSIEGGGNLHWVARALNWLLRYHALIEVGFDPDEGRSRVLTNQTFVGEAQRLRQDLGLSDTAKSEESE